MVCKSAIDMNLPDFVQEILGDIKAAHFCAPAGGNGGTKPPRTTKPPAITTTSASTPMKTIVGVAACVDSLSTLVKAVTAAGLVDTLNSAGPFTVFAPNNAAFAKIEGLDAILQNTELLKKILLLHVIIGKVVKAGALTEGLVAGDLTFNKEGGDWYVTSPGSKAKIVQADVGASNGVAHVIDTVLLPASAPAVTTMSASTQMKTIVGVAALVDSLSWLSTLGTAVKAADLVETLSSAGPLTVFAPNNAAFAKIDPDALTAILADKKQLTDILMLHVLAAKVMSSQLTNGLVLGDLTFTNEGGSWYVAGPTNKAKIIQADVGASNGVAHVIDTVLLPEPCVALTFQTGTNQDTCTDKKFCGVNEYVG